MSLSNQTQFVNLAGNGAAAQVFPFTFRCTDSSHLLVQFRSSGGVNTLVLNTDYTVFRNANQETTPGGTVTLTDATLVAPTSSITVFIGSNAPFTQPLDLPTAGPFSAAAVEGQLDNNMQRSQYLRDHLLGTLRASFGETLGELPVASARASRLLGFDAAGAATTYANASVTLPDPIRISSGTAALPSYSFTATTNTGMFSPGAGLWAVATQGVERVRVIGGAAGQADVCVNGTAAPYAAPNRGALNVNGTSAIVALNAGNAQAGNIFHDGAVLSVNQILNNELRLGTNNVTRVAITGAGVANYTRDGVTAEIGWRNLPLDFPPNASTLTAAQRGKMVAGGFSALTAPSGVFSAGDYLDIYVDGASAMTLVQGAGLTLRLAGTATTGNRTIATRGRATIFFYTPSEAIVYGMGVT
jgi:hypothetical protein